MKQMAQLDNLSFFTAAAVRQWFGASTNTTYTNLKNWLKSGRIFQLKRGLYVTNNYYLRLGTEKTTTYSEFIAGRLREPSYLSLEYVLQKYGVLAESTYAFTSVTLKTGRKYGNFLGRFYYSSITPRLFTGFTPVTKAGFTYYEATLGKALFDYFYFRKTKLPKKITREFLEDLRFNREALTAPVLREFKGYCKLTGDRRLLELAKALYDRR